MILYIVIILGANVTLSVHKFLGLIRVGIKRTAAIMGNVHMTVDYKTCRVWSYHTLCSDLAFSHLFVGDKVLGFRE